MLRKSKQILARAQQHRQLASKLFSRHGNTITAQAHKQHKFVAAVSNTQRRSVAFAPVRN